MAQREGIIAGAQRPHSILKGLLDAGVLDDYLMYESGTEARIVGGCLARVLLSGDDLVIEGPSGARRSERARDPFKQIERMLAEVGIPDWTAYGYVAFDVARFKGAALRFLDRLEREPRGVYGGTVGWIDSRGAADMAIAIRAVYQYGSAVRLNAGDGIVAESIEEREYIESVNKMNTIRSQLVLQPR